MATKDLNSYYGDRLDKYGSDDSRSCGYINNESHEKRQSYMNSLINRYIDDNSKLSILDIGVGPKFMMIRNLDKINPDQITYRGVELSSKIRDYLHNTIDHNDSRIQCIGESLLDINCKSDIGVCNGVLQDFKSKQDIYSLLDKVMRSYINPNGKFIIITPTNSQSSDEGEIYLSPFDILMMAENLGYPYTIEFGNLGKHIVLILFNRRLD